MSTSGLLALALLLPIAGTFVGCASLPKERVDALTQCKTPLAQVRRTLLKKGFALKADEPDFITTEAKMAGFGFPYPTSFLIEKTSDTSIHFTTRVRIGEGSDDTETEAAFNAATESGHQAIQDALCSK